MRSLERLQLVRPPCRNFQLGLYVRDGPSLRRLDTPRDSLYFFSNILDADQERFLLDGDMNWELGFFVCLGLRLTFGIGATEYMLDDLHREPVDARSAHEVGTR